VSADGPRLKRVLANLVTNACKHVATNGNSGPGGQVLIRVGLVQAGTSLGIANAAASTSSLTHRLAQKSWLRFEVHDNGAGVPVNLRPKLFVDPFVTAASVHASWQSPASPPSSDPRAGAPELDSHVAPSAERGATAMSSGSSGDNEVEEDSGSSGSSRGAATAATAARRLSKPNGSSNSSVTSGGVPKKQGFAARQGSGLGLFVANLCAQEMGGVCGFACDRDGQGGSASTAAAAASNERSLRAPVDRNAPPPPPVPRLGGSVFWVEVPYVPAVDEGLKRVNSGLRTLMHTGSSGDGMDQGTTAAPATVLGAVDLTKIGAAATGSRALPHDETTTVAAAPTAASTVSSDSSGSGSGDALNADVEGEGEDEGEEGRKNGQEWCKVCNLSDEDFVSSLVSVFEAAAAVAAKLSDEESLSNSGSSLPPEKAGSNPNGWDQHVVPELPPLPPPALREVPRVMGGGGANSSGGKGRGGSGFRSGGSGRLLVVDDSVMVKKLLCRALQQNNFSVDTAANGREGLIKMQNDGPYCAVLMDFLMPVLDGIAVSVSRRL